MSAEDGALLGALVAATVGLAKALDHLLAGKKRSVPPADVHRAVQDLSESLDKILEKIAARQEHDTELVRDMAADHRHIILLLDRLERRLEHELGEHGRERKY